MDTLIIYALACYFTFHVANRSDILAWPRKWAHKILPAWMVYVSACAFCWTWWTGVFLSFTYWLFTGHLILSFLHLCAAPVVNLLVDLVVRYLLSANEPPVVGGGTIVTCGDQSVATWTGATVWYPAAPNNQHGVVNAPSVWTVPANPDGEKIPSSMRTPSVPRPITETHGFYAPPSNAIPPPPPFNPLDHEQSK